MNDIKIELDDGCKLVASQSTDPDYPREIVIGIEDANGSWIQDLAIVRNSYEYQNGLLKYLPGLFELIIYGDKNSDDATEQKTIQQRGDA